MNGDFSRADLATLIADRPSPCLSLFLPTEPFGASAPRNPRRLADLLERAEEHLERLGWDEARRTALLAEARLLARPEAAGADFWRHAGPGLALFVAPGFLRAFHLERAPRRRLIVADRFALRPLLALGPANGPFLVVALSLHDARVIEGSIHGPAQRLAIDDLPRGMDEALGASTLAPDHQFHSAGRAGLGHRTGIAHGHGTRRDSAFEADLAAYLRRVTGVLRVALAGRDQPIVLAAVREYLPLWRKIWTDPRLLPESVVGGPDHLTDEELRQAAAYLVAADRRRSIGREAERVRSMLGSRRASSDPGEILEAAEAGRVEVMFVDRDAEAWGRRDEASREVELHEQPEPGDEEILEHATSEALRTHAMVYAVDRAEMPNQVRAAAIFRYGEAAPAPGARP